MKQFRVFKISNTWSTEKLIKDVENELKQITNAREIRLVINVDPNLIAGFLIKTKSKIVDFTIKSKLQNLAKHLDNVLDI
jgi:F0F1-type ATP synthase delta subunit